MTTDTTYNGYANYETWNVALWFGNDEGLYHLAAEYDNYVDLRDGIMLFAGLTETPDGVKYDDPKLDIDALNEMVEELN